MFPITCSSVGDIIAVADLVLRIAKALKESTGAAQDYRDFVYELEALASVMKDVGRRVQESSDERLRDAILDDIRHCCSDLERASQLTSGFDTLLRECALGAPGGLHIGNRINRGAKKLRWHFMRKAEAADFTQGLHRWCSLIHLRITFLNDDAARSRAQRQHRAMDDAARHRVSFIVGSLHELTRAMKAQNQVIAEENSDRKSLETSTQEDVRARLVVFPVCAMAVVFILSNPALTSPGHPVHHYAPWLALCAVVIHILLQAASIPPTVGYAVENSIIFIDFVGETLNLPPQLCGTMEDFCGLVGFLFSQDKRRGWSFVHAQAYEVIESSSSSALTSSSWSTRVKAGVKIQLGILIRRQGANALACPYCGIEVFQGPTTWESRDSLFCEGCRRSFQASSTQETLTRLARDSRNPPPGSQSASDDDPWTPGPEDPPDDSSPQQRSDAFVNRLHGNSEEPSENIADFEFVHVLHVITKYRPSRESNLAIHPVTANEFLVMGYIIMSLGPDNAIKLFNKFVGSQDFRSAPAGIDLYQDGSYRSAARPDVVLDYRVDRECSVVPRKMCQPAQTGDIYRHFRYAAPNLPVFFICPDSAIGVDMSYVLSARHGAPVNIFYSNASAPLGGVATTVFCLKWPGYSREFRKKVEAKDRNRAPITMSKLVERIATFVQRFIDEAENWPIDQKEAHWRVGPGCISKDHLYIVGLVPVAADCWQPIIQHKSLNWS